MPYWQLYYHLIWATKNRQPMLLPQFEDAIYGYLRDKAISLGAIVYAIGGIEDHIHMVVSIPPKIAVAKFIGQMKAVASIKFNRSDISDTPFFWQEEYSAFSFDKKRLPNYVAYVKNQKQHHVNQTTISILERLDDSKVQLMDEPTVRRHFMAARTRVAR